MKIIHTADWHIGQTFFGYDRFQEHQYFNKKVIEQFANYAEITPMFRKNVLKHYRALAYTAKKEPEMVAMVKKQEFRRERDVNDFKKMNFR